MARSESVSVRSWLTDAVVVCLPGRGASSCMSNFCLFSTRSIAQA